MTSKQGYKKSKQHRKMKSDHGEMKGKMSLEQKHMKLNDKTIGDLPEELLANILKGLPVKYILRCMCVQKSWYHLIHTPMFITLHGNYIKSNTKCHPKYLFFQSVYTELLTVRVDDIQCEEYCSVELTPPVSSFDTTWYAHSHGLVCVTSLFDAHSNIYLWNPLIQKYKTLPDSPLPPYTFNMRAKQNGWQSLAFGFVPQDNDYLVVRIVKPRLCSVPDPHSLIIGVYRLNKNSWKTMIKDDVFGCTIGIYSVFVDGAAFWLGLDSKRKDIVMCFDTKTDILRKISLPDWDKDIPEKSNSQYGLHPFGQSISFLVEDENLNHFDMWVLKDDRVNESSWEKKMSVNLRDDFLVDVLGLRNNGEPILYNLYDLVSYNLDSHETVNFVDSWDRWDDFSFYEEDNYAAPFVITPFVESLVLLNSDEDKQRK